MPRPTNITELQLFLGMVNYYDFFIKNLSSILALLHKLLQKGNLFFWSRNCENAFQEAKKNFKSDTVLAHFDPVDDYRHTSPYGVGVILSHLYPDGTERVLQYASQILSETQKRYT